MNSTIERKERVVARGFSHYVPSQLRRLVFVYYLQRLSASAMYTALVLKVGHSIKNGAVVDSIKGSLLGDKRRALTYA